MSVLQCSLRACVVPIANPKIKLPFLRNKVVYYSIQQLTDIVLRHGWTEENKWSCKYSVTECTCHRSFAVFIFEPVTLKNDIFPAHWTRIGVGFEGKLAPLVNLQCDLRRSFRELWGIKINVAQMSDLNRHREQVKRHLSADRIFERNYMLGLAERFP